MSPDFVLLQCADNKIFFFNDEDGCLNLPRKLGGLKVASREQLEPLVCAVPNALVTLVSSLEHMTCCEEENHHVNRGPEKLRY